MPSAQTIEVTMSPEMLRALRDSVQAGDYASDSEAMQDAVRVWQRERQDRSSRLEAIRMRLRQSYADPRPDLSPDEVDGRLTDLFEADSPRHGSA